MRLELEWDGYKELAPEANAALLSSFPRRDKPWSR